MPLLERCCKGEGKFSFNGDQNIAFFYSKSMLGTFGLKIRKLLATSEAEFNSTVGAGMGLNSLRADLC